MSLWILNGTGYERTVMCEAIYQGNKKLEKLQKGMKTGWKSCKIDKKRVGKIEADK